MERYYLAIDIGASSGRHMLGHIENGKMILEEIWRFENGMKDREGSLCWDLDALFEEIKTGMKRCKELGKIPVSMGIDTWAVDYVLLDEKDQVLGKTYGYRDGRTQGVDEDVYKIISEEELYSRTGIQKQSFNTIYQLMAVKKNNPEHLKAAKNFLMLPDYFHFLLTGQKCSEYTNATSTQLINAQTNDWDRELIERLGYPQEMFLPLSQPGTLVGSFTKEIEEEVGFSCEVVLPATHDTGSAVMALPGEGDKNLYISSGTWSLMGIENKTAICTEESRKRNFTNEGGYEYRYRYLKNIMGLWMIQSVRRELGEQTGTRPSFPELIAAAQEASSFAGIVSTGDDRFLAPKSMIKEVKAACKDGGKPVPATTGEVMQTIYNSLSHDYQAAIQELQSLTGKEYTSINIVGGGSQDMYLNQMTANATQLPVFAGPTEGTALGNLMVQMIRAGEFKDLADARASIKKSFTILECDPQ